MVRHEERQINRSNYTLRKLIHLWLNMFVNFSVIPLRISTVLGLFMAFIGAIMSIYVFIDKVFISSNPLGWSSIMVAVITFSGVQLLIIGLIGEYLGRLFLTGNMTPQYVIKNIWNLRRVEEKQ